ncbi:MAG: group III truncated hemoglobin [Saprospiraceae bacterium]|nr:group III truncated hemoglobin [Bacteroidia bacterium]NNE16491.1 group III truncated hemoglobin [Saprospiraceae bacterium]NNL93616.1 group III truncated hemoglobin [Saprospiraceae bacterium]
MKNLKDISSLEDIKLMIDTFYESATQDSTIGFIFQNHMSKSMEEHKPKIYNFWNSILFSKGNYKGNPIKTHINLDQRVQLLPLHFQTWIELWEATIDGLFEGPKANEVKEKAGLMKTLMMVKLNDSRNPNFIQ